jgi:hypothetical protein
VTGPLPVLLTVLGISAAGAGISSLESLSLFRAFRKGGPFSWEIALLRHPLKDAVGVLAVVFGWPGILVLHALRVAFAVACVAMAFRGVFLIGITAAYALTSALLAFRAGFLLDGADRMFTVTSVACFVGGLSAEGRGPALALTFLAAQLSLVYATAGAVKLLSPEWRSGNSLEQVLSTGLFGSRALSALATRRRIAVRTVARLVVAGELLGSLAPWIPPRISLVLLVCAFGFHLIAAVTMRLNTFLFAFPALLPAAWFVSRCIYGR